MKGPYLRGKSILTEKDQALVTPVGTATGMEVAEEDAGWMVVMTLELGTTVEVRLMY